MFSQYFSSFHFTPLCYIHDSSLDPTLSSWGRSSSSSSSPSLNNIIASTSDLPSSASSTRPKAARQLGILHPTTSSKSLTTPSSKKNHQHNNNFVNWFDRRGGGVVGCGDETSTSRLRRGTALLHASRSLQGNEEEEKKLMIAAGAGLHLPSSFTVRTFCAAYLRKFLFLCLVNYLGICPSRFIP